MPMAGASVAVGQGVAQVESCNNHSAHCSMLKKILPTYVCSKQDVPASNAPALPA
jgi:hypothetical protein